MKIRVTRCHLTSGQNPVSAAIEEVIDCQCVVGTLLIQLSKGDVLRRFRTPKIVSVFLDALSYGWQTQEFEFEIPDFEEFSHAVPKPKEG